MTVNDEGSGFDPDIARTSGSAAGGIGLFSMRERLDVIGGGMRIESAAGRGAPRDRLGARGSLETGWRLLPCRGRSPRRPTPRRAGPPRSAAPRRGRASRARAGRSAFSLVDDHAVVRDGHRAPAAQQPDIEIVGEAADGATAVELVRTLRPDVVTMDVNMPGMNGVDAARAIHAEHPRTRIIGLSMSEESEQGAAMRGAGAVHYLSKSASLDKLLAAIRGPSGRE